MLPSLLLLAAVGAADSRAGRCADESRYDLGGGGRQDVLGDGVA
jgi:hypothetical protein